VGSAESFAEPLEIWLATVIAAFIQFLQGLGVI
jgi:hypothetical protein